MPGLEPAHYNAMIAAFSPADGRAIIVPTHGAKRGNPVLWSKHFFAEMRGLEGDTGAKHLIGQYADAVAEVVIDSTAIFLDVDTPEALARVRAMPDA
jgi:molybdenum cofactor cytidylyltransferase